MNCAVSDRARPRPTTKRTLTMNRIRQAALALLALAAASAGAQVINESVIYAVNPPVFNTYFGSAIAANDSIVVIGARGASGPGQGSVGIYDRQTGAFIRNLIPTNGANITNFGAQVAIEGNIIIVSNTIYRSFLEVQRGVYVFDATTGTQLYELTSNFPIPEQASYGVSIDIDNNVIAVGSPLENLGSGSVYLYNAATGALLNQVFGDEVGPSPIFELFGSSVDLSNGKLAVGSGNPSFAGDCIGCPHDAYLFDVATGQRLNKISPPINAGEEFTFAEAVAINADTLVVTAPGDDPFGPNSGSVFTYDINTGALRDTLPITNQSGGGVPPMFVKISDTGIIAVAAPNQSGVDLFDAATGTLLSTLIPVNPGPSFSPAALAMDTNSIFVGEPTFNDAGETFAGIAYRFDTSLQITAQPQSQAVNFNADDVSFSVAAINVATYQWSLNGLDITDGPLFSGTDTNFLIVTPDAATEGTYQVTLTGNEFGIVQSDPAVLAILGNAAPDCLVDLNEDGTLNFFDISLFLQLFSAGCP